MRRCSSSRAAISRSADAITARARLRPTPPPPRSAAARASCAWGACSCHSEMARRPTGLLGRRQPSGTPPGATIKSEQGSVVGARSRVLGTGLLIVVDRVLEIVMRVVKLLHFGRAFFLALARRDALFVSAQCIDNLGQGRLKSIVRAGAVEGPGSRRRYQGEGKEGRRRGAHGDVHRSEGTPAGNGFIMPLDGRRGSPV